MHRIVAVISISWDRCRGADGHLVVSTDIWENIHGGFLDHLDEVNRDLAAAGLPLLEHHCSNKQV